MEYALILFISLIAWLISRNLKGATKVITVLYVLLVAFVAASRSENIPDTLAYIEFYENIVKSAGSIYEISYMEPGFILLALLIKFLLKMNARGFLFIVAFLNLVLIVCSINQIKRYLKEKGYIKRLKVDVFYPLIIYVLTFGFMHVFIAIRAGLSYGLFLYGYTLMKRGIRISWIIMLTSVFMHNSLLIVILSLPLIKLGSQLDRGVIKLWIVLLLPVVFLGYSNVIFSIVLKYLLAIPVLFHRFHPYLKNEVIVNQASSLIRIIVLIVVVFVFSKRAKSNTLYNDFLIMFLIGLTLYIGFINVAIIYRVVDLFLSSILGLIIIASSSKRGLSLRDKNILNLFLLYFIISNFRLVV